MTEVRNKPRAPVHRPAVPSMRTTTRGWHFVARTWLPFIGGAFSVLSAAAVGVRWYARHVEPRWIEWRRVTLPIQGLPQAFDGYRIVQLSDYHLAAGTVVTPDRLRRLAAKVTRLAPDVIALTGDFVGRLDPVSREAIGHLSKLRAHDGVLCVPGNHDYWNGEDNVQQAVQATGATWLINRARVMRRGDATLAVAGIDDAWEGTPDLDLALHGIAPETPVILLAHEPNFADVSVKDGRVAVQLSGHSHGGQIRIPGFGPVVLPDQAWRYPVGLYHVPRPTPGARALWVYTNRGLGMSDTAYRLFCRPEITIFTLRVGD